MTTSNLAAPAPGGRVLGLFAKEPQPGRVKTRLAAATSETWAMRVAEAFLLDTLDRLATVAARRVVAFAPPEAEAYFAAVAGDRFQLTPQTDGDLGRRLAAFVTDSLRTAEAVVLVGTDSPTLPAGFIEQAFQELAQAEVVLGPATDGGYYLVGCARGLPPIFAGITWGTSRVLHETTAALHDPGWRLALLPPWYDVDTLEDWRMLQGHVAALRRAGLDPGVPRTERLLAGSLS